MEFIEYLRTRSGKVAREWGYAYQNVSLKFRSKRCSAAWQGHLGQCHMLVRQELQRVKPKTIMVIGSGLLLEIPIAELLAKAEKIYLVDLVHDRNIRALAKRHPQIELVEKDVSCLLQNLKKGQGPFQLKNIPWEHLSSWDLPKVDWVISANLLSQIPLMISESIPMTHSTYQDFARRVRDQHIDRLIQQGDEVLLFADFETRYVDHNQNRLKTESYNVNLRDLEFLREWIWEVSPYGETSKDYKVEMLVKAYY